MVVVAVAGGTGKLGLAIVEQLRDNPNHKVIVLSRKQASETLFTNVPALAVDYSDVESLLDILASHTVHTVVSAMQVSSSESGTAEKNLVEAARRSKATKRFISSDWSAPAPSDPSLHLPYTASRLDSIAKLRTTDLEWTTMYVGQIMDYLGTPHLKSHLGVYGIHIDMHNKVAAIPGTGNELMSFTYSYDIARFVEVVLDLPHWEEETFCYGDVRTYNDVLKVAETQRGSKFAVTYDSVEQLQEGQMTELPCHTLAYTRFPKSVLQARFAMFGLYGVKGLLHLPEEKSLNKAFPRVKTRTVEDVIGAWEGK